MQSLFRQPTLHDFLEYLDARGILRQSAEGADMIGRFEGGEVFADLDPAKQKHPQLRQDYENDLFDLIERGRSIFVPSPTITGDITIKPAANAYSMAGNTVHTDWALFQDPEQTGESANELASVVPAAWIDRSNAESRPFRLFLRPNVATNYDVKYFESSIPYNGMPPLLYTFGAHLTHIDLHVRELVYAYEVFAGREPESFQTPAPSSFFMRALASLWLPGYPLCTEEEMCMLLGMALHATPPDDVPLAAEAGSETDAPRGT